MRILWLIPILMLSILLIADDANEEKPKNLGEEVLPNGDFEKADKKCKDIPAGWDEPDELTVFWVDSPDGKGKVLKFDSAVLEDEVKARKEEMKLPREKRPKPKPKTEPTERQKYKTIAATYGAQIWSHYFPLEHGKTYVVSVRYYSERPKAKLFIKGYAEFGKERRIVYRAHLPLDPKKDELNSWKEFWMEFTPQNPNPNLKVKWGKVKLMIYWPPGVAYADDVSIRPLLKEKNNAPKK